MLGYIFSTFVPLAGRFPKYISIFSSLGLELPHPEKNDSLNSTKGKKFELARLFVLMFYSLVNPMGSCRAQSVYLITRLLGRLSPLSG